MLENVGWLCPRKEVGWSRGIEDVGWHAWGCQVANGDQGVGGWVVVWASGKRKMSGGPGTGLRASGVSSCWQCQVSGVRILDYSSLRCGPTSGAWEHAKEEH